jgi:hypothetical protein
VANIGTLTEGQTISTAELRKLLTATEASVGRYVSTQAGQALVELHQPGHPSVTVKVLDRP